jgi:hypothetical protein
MEHIASILEKRWGWLVKEHPERRQKRPHVTARKRTPQTG